MLKNLLLTKLGSSEELKSTRKDILLKTILYLSALDKMIRKPAGPDLVIFIVGAL